MSEFICDIFYPRVIDGIKTKKCLCTTEFEIGDEVVATNNGLLFKVGNKKTLRWMKMKNDMLLDKGFGYVKLIKEIE